MPGTARNMPITAQNTISDTTRGLVSARNWRADFGVGERGHGQGCSKSRSFYLSGVPARSMRAQAVRVLGRGMPVRSECAIAGLRVPVRRRSRTPCRLCRDRARSPHHPRRPSRTLALVMPRPNTRPVGAGPKRRRIRCTSARHSATRAVTGSREGRLRRSRHEAGGAASEPHRRRLVTDVLERRRTGTRSTTRFATPKP